jgi:hypothetical protein
MKHDPHRARHEVLQSNMSDRDVLLTILQRQATLERLVLLLIQGEEQIIMDQVTEIALIEKAANLVTTLKAEVDAGLQTSPAVDAALEDLQTAVDAASAQTPAADASGNAVAAPNGSDTTADAVDPNAAPNG